MKQHNEEVDSISLIMNLILFTRGHVTPVSCSYSQLVGTYWASSRSLPLPPSLNNKNTNSHSIIIVHSIIRYKVLYICISDVRYRIFSIKPVYIMICIHYSSSSLACDLQLGLSRMCWHNFENHRWLAGIMLEIIGHSKA